MKARHIVILLLVLDVPACGYLLYERIAFKMAQPDPYWETIEKEIKFPPNEIDRVIAIKGITNIVVKWYERGIGVGVGAPQITLASAEQFISLIPKYERVFVSVEPWSQRYEYGAVKRYFASVFGRTEIYVYEEVVLCNRSQGDHLTVRISDNEPMRATCVSTMLVEPERAKPDSWFVRNAIWFCAVLFFLWLVLFAAITPVRLSTEKDPPCFDTGGGF